jgi:hypothetical protein
MTNIILRQYSVLIATGTVTPTQIGGTPLECQFDGTQNRSLAVSGATAADSFLVEVSLDNGTTWVTYQAASTGATNYFIKIDHPVSAVRITKTGVGGSATVTAII